MEPGSDPVTMLLTTGGGGLGGGAITAYVLTRLAGKNGNGNGNGSDAAAEMRAVAQKLDHTNELLNELLRAQARMEGLLQHHNQRG
jgi:hypothetical protein